MSSTSMVKARAAGLSRKLAEINSSAVPRAVGGAAIVTGSAFAAGYLDRKAPEIAGQRPSVALGIAAAVAGVATKSPKIIQVASGMLAPFAYQAGAQAADSMAAK